MEAAVGAWCGASDVRFRLRDHDRRPSAVRLVQVWLRHPRTFAEVPDAHNWTGWRDALDPHLTSLLQRVFS